MSLKSTLPWANTELRVNCLHLLLTYTKLRAEIASCLFGNLRAKGIINFQPTCTRNLLIYFRCICFGNHNNSLKNLNFKYLEMIV